jgi:DNA-directed RNA polymerase subunit L
MSLIEKKEKFNDDHIKFEINSNEIIKVSMVNALRRVMLTNIPMYGILRDNIDFVENTSLFDNDYLGHRLTFIPLINTLEVDYDKVILSINKVNDSHEQMDVYLSDFEVNNDLKIEDIAKYPAMLLTVLNPGQKLECSMKLTNGTCKDYGSSFSTVSTAVYYFKHDETSEDPQRERKFKRDKKGNIKTYVMNIEATGQYNSLEIFNLAIDTCIKKLNDIKDDIIHKKGMIVEFHRNHRTIGVRLIMNGENSTIGNLLTQYILDEDKDIVCGYTEPHPFDKLIYIDINYQDNTFDQIRKLVVKVIDKLNGLFEQLKKDFNGKDAKKITVSLPEEKPVKEKAPKEVDSSLNEEETTPEEEDATSEEEDATSDEEEATPDKTNTTGEEDNVEEEPTEVDSNLSDEETSEEEETSDDKDIEEYTNEDNKSEESKEKEEPKEVDSNLNESTTEEEDDATTDDETTDEEEEETPQSGGGSKDEPMEVEDSIL